MTRENQLDIKHNFETKINKKKFAISTQLEKYSNKIARVYTGFKLRKGGKVFILFSSHARIILGKGIAFQNLSFFIIISEVNKWMKNEKIFLVTR